jgi:hypothetical protein
MNKSEKTVYRTALILFAAIYITAAIAYGYFLMYEFNK